MKGKELRQALKAKMEEEFRRDPSIRDGKKLTAILLALWIMSRVFFLIMDLICSRIGFIEFAPANIAGFAVSLLFALLLYRGSGKLALLPLVGGVMMLLNETYGFTTGQLAAPQANAMAAVIDPLMNGVGAPWLLYAIGAVLAVVLTYFKVPALAFALGMFIPIELNIPLLVGGAVNWYVTTRSKNEEENKARGEKGTLIASGFIAGGALMGVLSALLRFGGFNPVDEAWLANPMSEMLSLVAYLLLIGYFIWATKGRVKG